MPIPALLPVVPPLPSDSERPNISITGADGVFWDMGNYSTGNVFLMPGFTGFDAPPTTAYTDGTPGIAGSAYLGSHDDPRAVFLPIYTEGATRAEAVAYRRALVASVRGLSRLCVAETDGFRRYLDCVYTGGAEGAEGVDNAGSRWAIYGLNFTAFDNPYWFGDVRSPTPWVLANPHAFFPLAPAVFTLSSSAVLGGTLIGNDGEVDAYPVWTLTGPATSLTLQLNTGPRIFTINSVLTAGQTLVIDTDPRTQTITDGTGANRWGDVNVSAIDLWPLPPGTSSVTVTVTGGTTATSLAMSYVPRYLMR